MFRRPQVFSLNMVGFMCNTTTDEEEKEELKPQSFVVANNKPDNPFDLSLLEHGDFSLPFDDCFIDFDSIKDLIEEESVVPYRMDDLGANSAGIIVEMSDFGVGENCIEMGGDGIGDKVNGSEECIVRNGDLKVDALGCLVQKESDFGAIEKCVEMGSDGICENVEIEEACSVKDEAVKVESLGCLMEEKSALVLVGKQLDMGCDGHCEKTVGDRTVRDRSGELVDIGCPIEEEMKKVSLDGVSNGILSGGVYSREGNDGREVIGEGKYVRNGGIENADSGIAESDELLRVGGAVLENAEKSDDIVNANDDGVSREVVVRYGDESDGESESESESSSSSSSSGSSSDEDEYEVDETGVLKQRKKKGWEGEQMEGETDIEDGEIITSDADGMIAWSEDEDDEDAAGGNSTKLPIRSKNELTVLPPVPPVNVTLLPHHQTLPIGVVSSTIGAQVIVEGVERHNPLNEGSILWITESRSPLGLVDELFGPVKNPYYIVRFNSESEVPAGIQEGTLISFVPEFANHVLNNATLYTKGYDASNENDEELSEELEFSDDEKEAEYRRMQKMKKRGTNDEKIQNRKNGKKSRNRFGAVKHGQVGENQVRALPDKPPLDQSQQFVQPVSASSCSSIGQAFVKGPASDHPFPQLGQDPHPNACLNNVWANGIPCQQAPSGGFPPVQGMPWLQQNHPQHVYQASWPSGVPFQQLHFGQTLPNLFMVSAHSNFGAGPAFAQWLPGFPQNFPIQSPMGMGIQGQHSQTLPSQSPFAMVTQSQHAPTLANVAETAVPSNGFQATLNTASKNNDAFQNFSPGVHQGVGRKSHCRGGGRFRGGRGRH